MYKILFCKDNILFYVITENNMLFSQNKIVGYHRSSDVSCCLIGSCQSLDHFLQVLLYLTTHRVDTGGKDLQLTSLLFSHRVKK